MSAHRKFIVVTAAVAAMVLPSAAQARPQNSGYGSQPYIAGQVQPAVATYSGMPEVVVTTPNSGFSWSDAAIGASVALAVMLVGLGGVLVARSNRTERARFHLT
jgi:hypothetical protein